MSTLSKQAGRLGGAWYYQVLEPPQVGEVLTRSRGNSVTVCLRWIADARLGGSDPAASGDTWSTV
jgi:hypothetical protein